MSENEPDRDTWDCRTGKCLKFLISSCCENRFGLIEIPPHHSSLLVESFAFLVALGRVNSGGALGKKLSLRNRFIGFGNLPENFE